MSRKLLFMFSLGVMAWTGFGQLLAQPQLTPPVAIGPQTLASGFYEFLTIQGNPSDDNGNIKGVPDGIAAGDTFWVYVTGIDATQVTGVSGGTVKFNLQDSEADSSEFKHIGISFSLLNPSTGGNAILSCYQSTDDQSDHGLSPSSLTNNEFDLRFSIYKVEANTGWTITPEFRLSSGNWIEFGDGAFTPVVDFDFFGAKLVVSFEDGETGTVSFDNYFVVGPIVDPDTLYVDDDWDGLGDGTIVQFPGEINIRKIGTNAFATLGEALFVFEPVAANKELNSTALNAVVQALPVVIRVAPGTYTENVDIYEKIEIIGSGSGTDPQVDTIIKSAAIDEPVIRIHGDVATGLSANDRLEILNLRVRDATGDSSLASGILVDDGSFLPPGPSAQKEFSANRIAEVATTAYLYFENITAVNNEHSGIAFEHDGDLSEIQLKDCVLDSNDSYGLYITSAVNIFDGLTVTGGQIANNGIAGLTTGPNGSNGVTNVNIDGTSFTANGNANIYGYKSNDIDMYNFFGNATIENLTVTGKDGFSGIYISGNFGGPYDLTNQNIVQNTRTRSVQGVQTIGLGNIILNNITVTGTYRNSDGYGAGVYLSGYEDGLANFSCIDVILNVAPVVNQSAANFYLSSLIGTLNIGNTTLGGGSDFDILNNSEANVDADSAIFTGATTNFGIEDRVIHAIDLAGTGLVTWNPDNVYLTTNSFFGPPVMQAGATVQARAVSTPPSELATIVRALNAAPAGDTVNVGPGTFLEAPKVLIQKDVVIVGQGSSSTIFQADGSTSNSLDSLRAWFRVKVGKTANFHSFRFDGNSAGENTIHEAVRMLGNGAFYDVDFRHIIVPGSYDGVGIFVNGDGIVDVTNCTFSNIGATGVHYANTNADGSVYRGNSYSGKGIGDKLDYAVLVDVRMNLRIVSSIISNNLGIALPVQPFREEQGANGQTTIMSAGIKIETTDDAPPLDTITIDSTDISNNSVGIYVGDGSSDKSRVEIKNSTLSSNGHGIFTESAQYIQAKTTDFMDNQLGVLFDGVPTFDLDFNEFIDNGDGVMVTLSSGQIENNIFSNNEGFAVYIFDEASTGTEIQGNEFCNSGIAVDNDGASNVIATGNYWGDPGGPSGAGTGDGDLIDSGVTFIPFETFTLFANSPCEPPYVLVEAKIFLEGPYDGNNAMTNNLNTQGGIPTSSPYFDGRTVDEVPEGVVDWVSIELWQVLSEVESASGINETFYFPVTRYSAFLHPDGRIVADDGTTGQVRVLFQQALSKRKFKFDKQSVNGVSELTYSYYIVIKHRNHLAIMSAAEVNLSNETSTLYDFTTGLDKTFSLGGDAMVSLGEGNFGMIAGDGNGDGGIDAFDRNLIWRTQNGSTWDYTKLGDFNLDGGIDAFDINLEWRPNNGKATQLPEIPE